MRMYVCVQETEQLVNEICWGKKTIVNTMEEMFPTVSHETSDRRTEQCCPAYPPRKDRVILPNYIQLFIHQMLQIKGKRAGEEKGERSEEGRKGKQVDIVGIEGEQG